MRKIKFSLEDAYVILKAGVATTLTRYHSTVNSLWHVLYSYGLLSEHMYTKIWIKHVKGAKRAYLLLLNAKGQVDEDDRQMLNRFDSMLRRYEA